MANEMSGVEGHNMLISKPWFVYQHVELLNVQFQTQPQHTRNTTIRYAYGFN